MATVYSDRGQGVRAPVVFYNRCNEAAAQLKPGDFNWKEIFAGGVRWFHSGGIFAALSPRPPREVIIEGMKAAKAAGAVTSFDLNYRAKLWNIWGGERRAPSTVLDRIVRARGRAGRQRGRPAEGPRHPGPGRAGQVQARSERVLRHDRPASSRSIPKVKVVATTLREVHSTNRHSWSAVAWINGKTYQAPTCELDVLDRVGGGDGFAAGFFYGLLTGEVRAGSGESRLGARRVADHVPRRHDDGDGGTGEGLRQGRLGAHPAVASAQTIGRRAVWSGPEGTSLCIAQLLAQVGEPSLVSRPAGSLLETGSAETPRPTLERHRERPRVAAVRRRQGVGLWLSVYGLTSRPSVGFAAETRSEVYAFNNLIPPSVLCVRRRHRLRSASRTRGRPG